MTTFEENIAKLKLMNYVENAESIDKMVLICEKFLEKYKKEDTKMPNNVFVAEYSLSDTHILQEYQQQYRKKYTMEILGAQLGKEIMSSKYVSIVETKLLETMTIKIRATVGVCKP